MNYLSLNALPIWQPVDVVLAHVRLLADVPDFQSGAFDSFVGIAEVAGMSALSVLRRASNIIE
jgi:hypothetical protein